jgi:hypothetical protein
MPGPFPVSQRATWVSSSGHFRAGFFLKNSSQIATLYVQFCMYMVHPEQNKTLAAGYAFQFSSFPCTRLAPQTVDAPIIA